MDFLNFSHYFSSPPNIRKAIFVASALITPYCGIRGGTRVIELEVIMQWAKSHLSLGGGEPRYDIVAIPYHGEAHWSLLVLEPSHTFHFDYKIGVHDYSIRDIFFRQICGALLLLQDVHFGDPTFSGLVEKLVLNVPNFTQVGSGSVDMLLHITFVNTWLTWYV
jgi:hypothetical protein